MSHFADISKAIDPARTGISKSALTSSTICMRKSYYAETVRDPDGRRVGITMNEPILFGKAVDAMTLYAIAAVRGNHSWTHEEAISYGISDAQPSSPADIDPESFREEMTLAMTGFTPYLHALLQRRGDDGQIWLQGWDGESLRANGLIGTPDIIVESRTEPPTVIDVKTGKRRKTEADLNGVEMGYYAHLYREVRGHSGVVRVAYLSWSRTKNPAWYYVEKEVEESHETIALAQLRALKSSLESKSADSVAFSTTYCASCQYAKPQPSHNFDGCEVGLAVAANAAQEVQGE